MAGKYRERLTFSNVVSVISLLFALGLGSAWAATELSKNDVKSKHIKNRAVKTKDLANNAVTSPKVADGSLLDQDFASGQLPAGPQGERGPQGDRGATGPIGPSTGYSARNEETLAWASGTLQDVQSLNLPAGSYVLNAKVAADNDSTMTSSVSCGLQIGSMDLDDGQSAMPLAADGAGGSELYSVHAAAVTLASPATVKIECHVAEPARTGTWDNRIITAVKVGGIG
jgi:hypothetical protein